MPDGVKDTRMDSVRPRPPVAGLSQPPQRRDVGQPTFFQSPDAAATMTAREAAAVRTRNRAKSAADRHSRFVRFAKISLPILGLLVAGAVFGRMWLFSHLPGLNMPAVLFSKNGLTMVEPRLTGRSRDRAYDIGANRATQDFSSPKVVNLEQLTGRVEMKEGGWAKIESKSGVYDGNKDRLKLAGGVKVTTSTGYLLNAQDADIELSKGNMTTDKAVHLQGPTGQLDAGAANVTDGGATIQFSGGVHMTINPAVVPATAEPDQQPGTGTSQ